MHRRKAPFRDVDTVAAVSDNPTMRWDLQSSLPPDDSAIPQDGPP